MKKCEFELRRSALRVLFGIVALAMLPLHDAGAQDVEAKPEMKLVPKAVTSAQLPEPGAPMVLRFEITNTRELNRPVRAMIVRDGRLLEVPLLKSYLNEKDHPTYEFQINAPLAELNYQFVAYDGADQALISDRYWVRRDCLPSIGLTNLSVDPALSPSEQLKGLFDKSVSLGEEIEQYEHVLKHLDYLQKLLKE